MKKYRYYHILFLKDNILQQRYYRDKTEFLDFVDYLLSVGYELQVSIKYLTIKDVKF